MDEKINKYNLRVRNSEEKLETIKKICKIGVVKAKKVKTSGDHINNLNDDCIHEVFKYLSAVERIKIERVCKRWQILSQSSWNTFTNFDSRLFKFLSSFDQKNLRRIFFKIFSLGGSFLKEVYFNLGDIRTDHGLNVLKYFYRFSSNIEKFSFFDGFFPYDDRDISNIDRILKDIFLENQNLKSIKIRWSTMLGECLLSLPNETIESIDIHARMHARLYSDNKHLKPSLKEAFGKLKNLKSCRIKSECEILEIILEEISFDQNNINYLRLKAPSHRQSYKPDYSKYFPAMKNLKTLILFDVTLNQFDLMSLPINSLEQFGFFYNGQGAKELLICLSRFINLKDIDIDADKLVTDEFCEKIIKCDKLKLMKLTDCYEITDEGLLKIGTLPLLENLYLKNSEKITDAILPALAHLKRLEICYFCNITMNGILNYIKSASKLEYLSIQSSELEFNETDIRKAIAGNSKILKIKIICNNLDIEISK